MCKNLEGTCTQFVDQIDFFSLSIVRIDCTAFSALVFSMDPPSFSINSGSERIIEIDVPPDVYRVNDSAAFS